MQIAWSNLDTRTAVHLWGKEEEGEMMGQEKDKREVKTFRYACK